MTEAVLCAYCLHPAELVGGDVIYPRRPDLHDKPFWNCAPCKAYVGCHPGTDEPLGRLANAELRAAKMRAHAAFDPLWRTRAMSRSEAYSRLAKYLGIAQADCHIGLFDLETCERVVAFGLRRTQP